MRGALSLELVGRLLAGAASAQDSGLIPEAQPLLARYVPVDGQLVRFDEMVLN